MRSIRLTSYVLGSVLLGAPALRAGTDLLGDVDGDRIINVRDLLALRQALDGVLVLPADAAARADVDGDGGLAEADFELLALPALMGDAGAPFGEPADGPVIEAVMPDHAAPGEVVELIGNGFGPAPAVMVGSTPALVVGAQAGSVRFVVPAASGPVFVIDGASGAISAGRSFVASADDQPPQDLPPEPGAVVLGLPAEVPLPNATFSVPIGVALPDGQELGCLGVRLWFDPGHVEVVCVMLERPDHMLLIPPCIDNAGGLLGSGSIRNSHTLSALAPAQGGVEPVMRVVFRCINYRPAMPTLVARVEALADEAFPAAALGVPGPRFVTRASALFPSPLLWNVPATLGVADAASLLRIDTVNALGGGSTSMVQVKTLAAMPQPDPFLVLLNDKFVAGLNEVDKVVMAAVPDGTRSGPVALYNLTTGALSTAGQYVVSESKPPTVVQVWPLPGAIGVAPAADLLVGFSEVLDAHSLVDHGIILEVNGAAGWQPLCHSLSITPYGTSLVRIRPALPLPSGSVVRIRLAGTLVDLSQNPLAPVSWTFATAP